MERRGRIPVATYRTPEGKTRSRSRVRDPNYNKSDPETDLFTLLEDNIALREENDTLLQKNTKFEDDKNKMDSENTDLKRRIKELEQQHGMLKSQMVEMNLTLNRTIEEKMHIKSTQQQSAEKIKKLTRQIEELKSSQYDYTEIIAANKLLKEEICKLVPAANTNEFESLIDTEKDTSHLIATECIQKLIVEFTQTRNNLNNAELHLYEANEKISELLENQTHLEEEIEQLRTENTNLTRVAELMTTNMRESVCTSKKMEEALIEMKRRNDELTKHTTDAMDGSGDGTRKIVTATITPINNAAPLSATEEISRLRDEINRRDLAHGERIVEMKKLMDAAIENTSNEEIRTLRLKVEMLEKDLNVALERAERAELKLTETEDKLQTGLVKLKTRTRDNISAGDESYQSSSSRIDDGSTQTSPSLLLMSSPTFKEVKAPPVPPPPPPPPMPKLNFPTPTTLKYFKGASGLNDAITTQNLCGSGGLGNGGSMKRKQQVESTGLDALVKELKDGNVTLRRARRRTQTNAALKELFDVLEESRKQNRNSKLFIENHMTEVNFHTTEY